MEMEIEWSVNVVFFSVVVATWIKKKRAINVRAFMHWAQRAESNCYKMHL